MNDLFYKSHLLRLVITVITIFVLISNCSLVPAERTKPPVAETPSLDKYGGLKSISTKSNGYWRTEQIAGVWWLVTPEGHGLFSAGVNNVDSSPDFAPALRTCPYEDYILQKYGTHEAWSDEIYERLQEWGFNTIGAWSEYQYFDKRMPFTPILSFSSLAPEIPNSKGNGLFADFSKSLRDYFDSSFTDGSLKYAIEKIGEWNGNPYFMGVFTDNELPWGLSAIQRISYIDAYISLPAGAPGKIKLQQFFREKYNNNIWKFNLTWGQFLSSFDQLQYVTEFNRPILLETTGQKHDRIAFREIVATQYYSVVNDALKTVDPNILNLGSRFISIFTAPDVIKVAGNYVDVISLNNYQFIREVGTVMDFFFGREGFLFGDNPWDDLDQMYEISGKPIMITEYSYRAIIPNGQLSGHPPGFPTFNTQQQRADYYSHYMNKLYDLPYVVGAHWFEFCDQPATGRGDGENNNFGVVNIKDEVYHELTTAMRAMNNAVRIRKQCH